MKNIIFIAFLALFQSCSQDYPKELKTGVFRTVTELNTEKYMYRNNDYRYIYSDAHPGGNKLAKITWQNSGYLLETINKTSKYDSLVQTIVLDEIHDNNSFTETTYTEGIGLNFTSKWTRVNKMPEQKLNEVLKDNGLEID